MEQKGTLKYRKVQRTPQTGENAGKKKWYATSVTDREVDFEGFVSHISDHGSPYSRGTIHGVLMDALDHLQELILDGKSVRLSDLGLFSIGMSSKAEDTKEKVAVTQLRAAALTPARAAQVLLVVEPKKAAEAALRIAAMGLNKALA